jgi:hypothetical protein
MSIDLKALVGTNPIGLLAALGTLAAIERQAPHLGVRLRWTTGVVPYAQLMMPIDEFVDLDEVIRLVDEERQAWGDSLVLYSGPSGEPELDVKPDREGVRAWAALVAEKASATSRRDADLFEALLAEDALASKSDGKPTHLHFSAGQQKFLAQARELAEHVGPDDLREALAGPWRHASTLPVLGWDARGERIYALRGFNPSGEKKRGVPGADWLGFVGLSFFPVARSGLPYGDPLLTTGCGGTWKQGTFRWPLWSVPLSAPVIKSVLADRGLADANRDERAKQGVFRMLEAPIRRSDQGGYGSFGPAGDVEPPAERSSRSRRVAARG